MARLKIYYPVDQIINNLYTNGGQYMLESGAGYTGSYHRYSTGEIYTESGWNQFQSKKLIPYKPTYQIEGNMIYKNITKVDVDPFVAPRYYFPILKEDDYVNGSVDRYFIQRNNLTNAVFSIIEIDADQYSSLVSSGKGINAGLYTAITIPWKLTGPRNDVRNSNNAIVQFGVEDTNQRIVQLNKIKMPGLDTFINDYIELSVYSNATSQEIKNKFL